MTKFTSFLVFIFAFSCSYSQNTVSLKGKIVNATNQLPIESATVYLSISKDSTLVDYTITDKNGFFDLKVKKTASPTFLKISNQGFEDYKKSLTIIDGNIDLKIITIKESAQLLGEVVIKHEAPPIRIKKDTLEFNASSFKVRPDANVETLLKQLPGVEVGTDGKITVNGKEVNQILVNGKPFFDKDGKVALQSLPSELIKKVQISDTKTKKEELTGQAASSNNASINLTIDKDKEKGLFGKFMGGYGSDKRYESSGLVNYFKSKRKISVLASSNNINSTGFSMDEIFDNMGGGRNSFYYSDNGSFGIGNVRFGGGKGITQSNLIGLNYSDELIKELESTVSYLYTDANSRNTNTSRTESLLPTGKFITNSFTNTTEDRSGHNVNLQFEYKIDSTSSISVRPDFLKANSNYFNNSNEISTNENNQLLNKNSVEGLDENKNVNFGNSLNYNKSFKRKGRYLNVSFVNKNAVERQKNINKSATIFYQSTDPDDIRDQTRDRKNIRDSYTFESEYSEPIKDSLTIKLALVYGNEKKSDNKQTFDFESITNDYSNLNSLLSSYMTSSIKTTTPRAGFAIEKKAFSFQLNMGTSITKFDNYSLYLNRETRITKNYIYPFANGYLNYNFNKSKSIWLSYDYNVDFADASQILPVENLSNPVSTFIGNSNITPNKYHGFYFSFRDFKAATKSGYSLYGGGNFYESQIVSSTTFDVNRRRNTTYENVSGTYNSWFGVNYNKTIKKEAHTFKYSFGISGNKGLTKGITNGETFEANALRITPRVNFTYDYGELLTINPSYNYSYNSTKYTNYVIDAADVFSHRFNIQVTNYWPKNWVFGNDFGYTYNSNIADGFKKDFYLWNTSLSYSFFNKKITTKVKVYDLLNQNLSTTRYVSATSISDEENTVLKRYIMFSLTYKIEKFAGKEKTSRSSRFMY
jgi:Outer membrane protein beta-barrel family/CarboxypepD_reg-like domain